MSYVIFKTKTLLDIRAITTFGLSVKPNSTSPIGYFGTGLKMAIATLLRANIPIRLFIGLKEYEFFTETETFRDVEYSQVHMKQRHGLLSAWSKQELPFTLSLARNWELWMAFRELYANTLDEGGTTTDLNPQNSSGWELKDVAEPDTTTILVGNGLLEDSVFNRIYRERDTIFLPFGERTPTVDTPLFQVFHEPSDYIYYRGMRVGKLDKPSIMTYNVLTSQQLTEDRTLKEQWWLPYQLVQWLAGSTDKALINHFLNATEGNWESTWPFDHVTNPGTTFVEALKQRRVRVSSAKPLTHSHSYSPTPIHFSSRMDTLIKNAAPPTTNTSLQERFEDWYVNRVFSSEVDDADFAMLQEVLDFIKKHEHEQTEEDPF